MSAELIALSADLLKRANSVEREAAAKARKHGMIRIRSDKARLIAVFIRAMVADQQGGVRMVELNKLPPEALKAAMRGGTAEWGRRASAAEHVLYVQKNDAQKRRRCHCGCGGRKTHGAFANGIILMGGCEMSCRRWAKAPALLPQDGKVTP
jgi:hypothetical protein